MRHQRLRAAAEQAEQLVDDLAMRGRLGDPRFAVDRMLGQQEVVVRPIEDALVRVHGVSGTTDLGDGRPTLVLDLAALSARLVAAAAEAAP